MMIEAGGSERRLRPDRRGRRCSRRGASRRRHRGLQGTTSPRRSPCRTSSSRWPARRRAPIGGEGTDFPLFVDYCDEIMDRVKAEAEGAIAEAITITDKQDRRQRLGEIEADVLGKLDGGVPERQERQIKAAIRSLTKKLVRKRIVDENVRLDGRKTDEVRPIWVADRHHPTRPRFRPLHAGRDPGAVDRHARHAADGADDRRPLAARIASATCTTTTSRLTRPARPASCGGRSAARSDTVRLPRRRSFPSSRRRRSSPTPFRVVTEILSSNGSTSMASVCGSSLSLMDAGVPLRGGKHVGGVAMGLIAEDGKFVPLTDILGDEDAFGDMDFKVAGTEDVVTALQLDTKISGVPAEVLRDALMAGEEGSSPHHRRDEQGARPSRATELAAHAPRVLDHRRCRSTRSARSSGRRARTST